MMVVFACAASAGIHAGLVPEHLKEEPRLGVAFVLATVALFGASVAVALRPRDQSRLFVAALMLGGLVAAYAASRSTGIPLLAPDPEAVDLVGVASVLIELTGVAFALRSANQSPVPPAPPLGGKT
jgi:hypothetical protein